MIRAGRRVPYALGWATAALMVLAAGTGIAFPSVYRDVAWIRAAWLGDDIVTLGAVVPMLVAGLVLARRGSRLGELLVDAAFAYSVYGYAYYLFGASLNALFPLYVALLVIPLIGLMAHLGALDAADIAAHFASKTGARFAAVYMVFVGLGLGMAWLAQWAAYIFAGIEPSVGVEPFALVAALDLSLIVPFMLIGGALLVSRKPWGYVIGAIYTVKGATYTLALTAGSVVGAIRDIAGSAEQIPIWAGMSVIGAVAAVMLLRGIADTVTGE